MYTESAIYGAAGHADIVESLNHRITAAAETTPPIAVVLASALLQEAHA
jgi:hypothetical protein